MEDRHVPARRMLSKSNLVLGLKIAVIVTGVLLVFYPDLVILINDALQNEATSYILAVPFLFVYLIYRKRKMLRAVIPLDIQMGSGGTRHLAAIAGALLSVTAMLIYWYGSYTFTPLENHMLTLPIFVAGLVLILFNPQTLRQLVFPLAFLILLTPPPSQILNPLGSTLSVISSEASYSIISFLGIPSALAIDYGNPTIQITRPGGATMSFAVNIACSGVYSLLGFLVFAVFIAFIIRDKMWKKLGLFLIGFLVIYLLNIARITTILLIGYEYGEEIALQLFHLAGGWVLIFIGTFLLLTFGERILRAQIFTKASQKCAECNEEPPKSPSFCLGCGRILKPTPQSFRKVEVAKMAAVVLAIIFLVSIQTPVFALTEGPAQIIVETPKGEQGNIQLLPQVGGYTPLFMYRDKEYEEMALQDASLIYIYVPSNKSKESVWVAVEIGSATSKLHGWEVCLISSQIAKSLPASVTQLDLKDVQISPNPPIIARYFAFQWIATNQTQVVLYWYTDSIFMTNGTAQERLVKISLITYPNSPENLTRMEELLPFATRIALHWQPIKTWSEIALLFSKRGLLLAEISSTLILAVAVLWVLELIRERKTNARTYQKLSTSSRQIINAVLETEKTRKPTLYELLSRLHNKEGRTDRSIYDQMTLAFDLEGKISQSVEQEELLQRLLAIEKTGIVRSNIANINDEPHQIWQSQMNLFKRKWTLKNIRMKGYIAK